MASGTDSCFSVLCSELCKKKKKMISKAVHVLEGHTSRRRGVSVCVCGVLVRLPLAKSNTI